MKSKFLFHAGLIFIEPFVTKVLNKVISLLLKLNFPTVPIRLF